MIALHDGAGTTSVVITPEAHIITRLLVDGIDTPLQNVQHHGTHTMSARFPCAPCTVVIETDHGTVDLSPHAVEPLAMSYRELPRN